MKLRTALLAATILAVPAALARVGSAQAQPINGLYIGGGAGYNILEDQRTRPSAPLDLGSGKLKFNGGWDGLGSIGYGFGNGLRIEIEGNYRQNGLHGASTPYAVYTHGEERSYGVMANALFDFDIGQNWMYPYVGAGAGYEWTDMHHILLGNAGVPFALSSNSSNAEFAYQAIAGVAFPIPQVPGLAITAEYRFFSSVGPHKFDATDITPAGAGAGRLELKDDTFNHSVMLGLRYAFNVAPPAPPPAPAPAPVAAPAPAPARTYLVFFDWDRADLSDRARQIIRDAAQASTRVQVTRIEVNGNADLSGSPQYNQALSQRRAQAVAAELVRDGVNQSEIDMHAYGDTRPLVPTARGVREPQNRRVEIILH